MRRRSYGTRSQSARGIDDLAGVWAVSHLRPNSTKVIVATRGMVERTDVWGLVRFAMPDRWLDRMSRRQLAAQLHQAR
jgi:hypothetical protein